MALETKSLVDICNDDRISELPDDVLSHILSFLPTKYSVRTRVLSKRWKQLFTLVPVLDFFYLDGHLGATRRFLDFVNWVFNSYNVDQMDRFSYNCYEYLPVPSPLSFWISEALRRGVRELDVYEDSYKPYKLSCCFFTCNTLTDLKIHGNFYLEVPENACLPHVKTLHLLDVCIVGDCLVSRLLRSCPVLEDLSIALFMKDNEVLNISIPTLKSLKMDLDNNFELVLNVPNVEYIEFGGNVAYKFSAVQQFKSLDKASIDFGRCSEEVHEVIGKLVSMVCHVRHLSLSTCTLEDFQKTGRSLPTFRNLAHLEMTVSTGFGLELVLDLLVKTPLLEVLVVDNVWLECNKIDRLSQLLAAENVPECVSLHLKQVEFRGFFMENECKLVKYILKNAQVLDTLNIQGEDNLGKHFREKVKTFPRCSRDCQIVPDLDPSEDESEFFSHSYHH